MTPEIRGSCRQRQQRRPHRPRAQCKLVLDNPSGVGTQKGFSYDSLNRLNVATLLGGAVSPTSTTEVIYDARGNIAYKSDVGYYTYDPDRPNRMTNVTLTQPASWSASTAVTHDTVNARHTVRGESYTSYNMPGVITSSSSEPPTRLETP